MLPQHYVQRQLFVGDALLGITVCVVGIDLVANKFLIVFTRDIF